MKKLLALALALLMLLSATPVLADGATLLWETTGHLTPTNNPAYLKVYKDHRSGLYSITDGKTVISPIFVSMEDISSTTTDYYTAAFESGLNTLMIIDGAGKPITGAAYGEIRSLGEDWAYCIVLSEGTEEDYDYKSWNAYYIADRFDFVYLPTSTFVGSLNRTQFKEARAYGEYLIVEDDAKNVTVYNTRMAPVQCDFTKLYDYTFKSDGENIFNVFTGETVATGYTGVSVEKNYLIARTKSYEYALLDTQGNMLLPAEYRYISYNTNFFKLDQRDSNNKTVCGAYDPVTGALLPCAYDAVNSMTAIDGEVYFLVEKDGKIGYVNGKGEVTCPIAYSKNALTSLGLSMYAADLDGTIKLISADGQITPLPGVVEINKYSASNANGRYILAKNNDGLWGVMDWHGKTVVDFSKKYSSDFTFVNMDYMILNGTSVYELN